MKYLFTTLLFLAAFLSQTCATTWYVKTNGNDNNSGATWNLAFQNLQTAIEIASAGDEVWVAAGTYLPDRTRAGTNPRDRIFYIGKDIKIFGGFPAAGGSMNERNWIANPTILSGDLGMQGNASDNVYHIVYIDNRSTDMWLDGFTIQNGNANGDSPENQGGGIYNYGDFAGTSTPTIQHCKILNNNATVFGGGVYNDGSVGGEVSMIMTDCIFSGNTALLGGSMYNDSKEGGYASPILTDCVFSNNTATYGGAMYNLSENNGHASPVLKGCTFSGNRAVSNQPDDRTGGGAVFNDAGLNTEASPKFTNCTFSNNSAIGYKGGAIYSESHGGEASPSLIFCTFSGNTAAKGGSLYCHSEGVASAGGYGCTFFGNTATLGGVLFYTSSAGGATNPVFTNSLFFNNSATERGGVLAYDDAHVGSASFYSCTFSKNTAPQGGVIGILSWNYGHKAARLWNCVAWGNSSTFSQTDGGQGTLDIDYSLIQEAACPTGATCATGVIYAQDPLFLNAAANDFHLQNGSPAQNTAHVSAPLTDFDGDTRPQGPASDMGYDEILFVCPSGTIVFVDKDATSGANNGASWANAYINLQDALDAASSCPNIQEIWVAEGTYLPTVYHNGSTNRHKTFFINFDVKIFGGFAGTETMRSQRNWNTHPTILSGDIGTANDISDNAYHVVWIEGRSSAMELDGFTITKGKLKSTSDEFATAGAGIYNNAANQNSTPTIRNCTITGNEGGTNTGGAGMYNAGNPYNASPTLTNCTFSNNTVPGNSNGGAIYNYATGMGGGASPVLTNCTFTNNYAAFRGGAIFSNADNQGICAPVLTNCAFTGNTVTFQTGGAIHHFGQMLTLNNCTFTNNTAFIAGAVNLLQGSVTATDCTFSGNTSPNVGAGAISLDGDNTSALFTRCTFSDNSAGTNGGAVTMYTNANSSIAAIFDGCTFSGNSAANGGAIFTQGNNNSGLYLNMINCRFFNNTATGHGGAFCSGPNTGIGSSRFYHCTLYNNIAPAGGGGAVGISQYIANQPAPLLINCIAWNNSSTFDQTAGAQGSVDIQYSLIQEAACPAGAACTNVIYNKNPLFVNAAANNFHLQACSPAVNTAVNIAIINDFDGIARPQNGGFDMGAFEYQGPICVPSFNISGRIIWKQDNTSGVKDATVALTGDQTGTTTSVTNGNYTLTVTSGTNFTITPSKNLNKLNGVNAQDVARLQQHLSGNLIIDPWQLIAADANSNGVINALDLSIIQQSILGNPQALAQMVNSWRFAPTSHVMSNPPWGFPEKITLSGVSSNQINKDFYGIKVGDVAATYANPANFGAGEPLVFHTADRMLEAGSTITVNFSADALTDLAAFQFALHFDPTQLHWTGVESLGVLSLSADNFGTLEAAEGNLKCLWAGSEAVALEEAAPVFQLTFQVLKSGQMLREVLQLDEVILPGRVYNSQLAENMVWLHFFEGTSAVDAGAHAYPIELLQNQPNPFIDITTIGFVLPAPCTARLRILDAAGRIVTERTGAYPEGRHNEVFQLAGKSGVLYYELDTPWGHLVRKMVAAQ